MQATLTLRDEETIAHDWLRRNHMYMAPSSTLVLSFWHHIMSCMRRPAGRADRAGSQQCEFEMEIPTLDPLLHLLAPCQNLRRKVYSLSEDGSVIEWHPSSTKDSYYIDDHKTLQRFAQLHTRGLDVTIPLHGSTKGVPPTKANGYTTINSVVTMLPPLIIEDCTRSYNRRVLSVSFNVCTLNDLDGQKLPPHFQYETGLDFDFKLLALRDVRGMKRYGHPVSPAFMALARQHLK